MVYDEVKQDKGLVQGDQAFARFGAEAIDHITLQPKQVGKNSDDDRRLPVLGEAKNNAAGFMKHGFGSCQNQESLRTILIPFALSFLQQTLSGFWLHTGLSHPT